MNQKDFLSDPNLCTEEVLELLFASTHFQSKEAELQSLIDETTKFSKCNFPIWQLPECSRVPFIKVCLRDSTESLIYFIDDDEIVNVLIKKDPMALKYVKKQTPEICMAAMQRPTAPLHYVKEQTPEICMAAVQEAGGALQCVREQTTEICMAAVKQNGSALYHVKEQTPEICMVAVQQWGWALKYVKKQTPELCMAAVKQWGEALQLVRDPKLKKMIMKGGKHV